MSQSFALVLGTHNKKKGLELADLLTPHGFEVKTLGDFADAIEVEEDGDTFAANAELKASRQAVHLGHWVIGEDSGLAVDQLGGAPGVYSARFSGSQATDQSNNDLLLAELAETPLGKRTAHYVCHVSVADPNGMIRAESASRCNGRIRFEPVGSGGFGYDPLFEVVEYHKTFAQLGTRVKAVLSHRARAMRRLLPQLIQLKKGHEL